MSDIVVDANGGRFYYSNRTNSSVGQIIARDLTTGANPITVVDNLAATVNGIALDRKNEFLFWADGTSAIGRSSLSGTGKINIVTGLNAPVDVALDFSSSLPPKLYWTEPGINEIHRMNTDGSDFERYFSDFTSTTNGIAIDQTTRYAYWTDETQPLIIKGFINETTFSALDTLVDYGYGYVGFGGVALDPSNHMIYFAYTEGGKIQRADYNLPTPIAVGSIQDLATISNPFGVAVDLVRKKLYYTSNDLSSTNTGTLTRSNLDGTNPEVLITQSISSPQRFMRDVKVDVKNRMVYWALSELDGVATIYKANIADVAGTATPLINNTSGEIRGIEIDFSSDQLWWVSRGISNAAIPPAIKNAKLSDGSGVNTLHTITFSPTANFIALDRGCEQPIASGLSLNALHGESSTVDPVVTSYHHVNDIINVNITQNPTKGVVVVQSDGKISYTPNDGTSGVDVIGYEICNQCGLCDQAIINITIPYVPPVIIPPSGTTSIIVYTGMSPNGDQFNPYFRIENIEIVEPQNKVSIFNRWGDKVFEIENYNNSDPAKRFNGESDKGKDLPTGIYFYKIEFGSGSPELTGYLTIKR
ncbi:MAG: gliding motility-associated C-terminal domain-containing protein [Cyclobacteriaceae bacterium]|nr:gliding motility-associated C-terminal domain-containing protein [Cyclobacteriaceae bacterium]